MPIKTPVLPPLEDFLTIPETLDFHLKHNADQAIFAFSETPQKEITTITYLEFARACDRVAHAIRPGRKGTDGEVVAVIMLDDTIAYQATTVGLMRAGFVPFPMSPRISAPAVVHLLRKTSCHHIITTYDTLRSLMDGIKAELSSADDQFEVRIGEVPPIQELYPKLGHETVDDPFDPYPPTAEKSAPDHIAMYLHSSGSTGFPKAIPETNLALLEWISFGMLELTRITPRIRLGAMALPSFHTLGIYVQLLLPLYGVLCISVYPPTVFSHEDQPIIPTSDNILDHLRRTKSTALMIVPAHLQIWAGSQEAIDYLKDFTFIGFSGGPLSEKLGDLMADAGVNLKTIYGGTEFGAPCLPQIERGHEKDWEWVEFSDQTNIKWVDEGDGKYECQFLVTDTHHPSVENMDHARGYATSDIFEKHPTKPNHWRVIGRKDDVIIHSSGEKTVPLPMEEIMCSSPLIKDVVMFGRKHDQAGVLVDPMPQYHVDVSNEEELATLRNKIWPVVEEANRGAPAFSRIYKEMILIVSPDKPLPRSPKGTVMRKAALLEYDTEIEELYRTVESATGGDVVPPDSWDADSVREWIIAQANDIRSGGNISSSKDWFEQGFDSLSATFLRLRLSAALRSSGDHAKAADAISQNVIYSYPTADALTEFVVGIVADPEGESHKSPGGQQEIERMIEKYSSGLDTQSSQTRSARVNDTEVVLMTGTTGNLGAQILANLLQDEKVQQIYALHRPSSESRTIASRHVERFEDKGLDAGLLETKKLVYVEADTSEENLGLDQSTYDQIRNSVTLIIHVAWRLDFNLALTSFESNVRGTRNLIDLVRSGPNASIARFIFTSSISSAQSWDSKKGPYPEEIITDASVSVGGGYGEGKYVAERILARSGLEICSLRIGQVSGGLPNGAWATSDWVPILVKSSLALKAFPDIPGVTSWVPMDAVCRAVLDVAFTKDRLPEALNFVHPRPIPWTSMISSVRDAAAKELKMDTLPLIPLADWVARLQTEAKSTNEENMKKIPAIKLLGFFQGISQVSGTKDAQGEGEDEKEVGGIPKFQIEKAEGISPALRDLGPIDAEDTDRWVAYWNKAGFFE